jgi:hypothetical protein
MIDLNTAVSGMQQIREGGSKVSSKGAPSSGGLRANELMMKITCRDLLNTHDVSKLDVELP